jgi:hypothetical protein
LYRITDGGKEGLKIWESVRKSIAIDKKTDNYHTFSDSHNTLRTLGYYARLDDAKQYAEWHKAWCKQYLIAAAEDPTDNNIAKAVHRYFWLDYCFSKNVWYKFTKHRWVAGQMLNFRKSISNNFKQLYEKLRAQLDIQIAKSNDKEFKKLSEVLIKCYSGIIKALESGKMKDRIIRECQEFFSDYNGVDFEANQNADTNLTANEDCVIEVHGREVIIRDGKPDDFLTISTGVHLVTEKLSYNHPTVIKLMDWLSKVFVDKELLKHFLKFSASCLKSKNSDKLFLVMSGGGDNSKSMVVKLFEASFGAYCIKFTDEMITQTRNSNSGPSPELAQAKWSKIAFIDEPEDNRPLFIFR